MKNKIIIITGTTASGKTAHSIELAKEIDGEIINCDSMQIYREVPILTAQPTIEEQKGVPHHLFSIVGLNDKFSVGHWLKLAIEKITDIQSRGKVPIIIGGTGLYVKAIIEGITETPDISDKIKAKVACLQNSYEDLQKVDPETAERLEPADTFRIKRALEVFYESGESLSAWHKKPIKHPYVRKDFHLIEIVRDRDVIYNNINERFMVMMRNGSIEECKKAYALHGDIDYPKAHGLPEIIRYLNGDLAFDKMILKSQQNIRNYAKRQLTFFRHQFTVDETINL